MKRRLIRTVFLILLIVSFFSALCAGIFLTEEAGKEVSRYDSKGNLIQGLTCEREAHLTKEGQVIFLVSVLLGISSVFGMVRFGKENY